MTDRKHTGARCRTVRHITTREGRLYRHTYGTIRYEMDNLGRHLQNQREKQADDPEGIVMSAGHQRKRRAALRPQRYRVSPSFF